jgi:hypothetical protein
MIIRRKLDNKTAQHHYFRKVAVKSWEFLNDPAFLYVGKYYDTQLIEDTETCDSESGTYVCVGFWRDD